VTTPGITDPDVPPAPFVVGNVTGGAIQLSWVPPVDKGGADIDNDFVGDITGYLLYMGIWIKPTDVVVMPLENVVYSLIYSGDGNKLTTKIGGLTANTSYIFRLRPLNTVSPCASTSRGLLKTLSTTNRIPLHLLSPVVAVNTVTYPTIPNAPLPGEQLGATGGGVQVKVVYLLCFVSNSDPIFANFSFISFVCYL
jgi:hypothetical protein